MITVKKASPEKVARRFFLKKKWSKAIDEYQKLLRDDDTNLPIVNLIGDAYFLKDSRDEAFLQYRKTLAAYEDEGLFDNAIAIAKKIARLHPEDTDIHLKLAELYTGQAFLADALTHLSTYLNLAGKRWDEKAVRLLYQKMAGVPNRNPQLWDEIAESYRRLKMDDPELDHVMASGGSVAGKSTPREPEGGAESKMDGDYEDSSSQMAHPPKSKASGVGAASQMEILPLESAAQEFPPVIASEAKQPPQDDLVTGAEADRSFGSRLSDWSGESEIPLDAEKPLISENEFQGSLEHQEESASTDLQLEDILKKVLPPEEKFLEEEIPPSAEKLGEEATIEPESEKSKITSFLEVDKQDMATTAPASIPPSADNIAREPEPDLENVDASPPVVEEEAMGMDTLQTLPKAKEEDTEAEEEEALWTLPYEVAEETVPEESQPIEESIDRTTEHTAVESMLTGFSGDEPPKKEPEPPMMETLAQPETSAPLTIESSLSGDESHKKAKPKTTTKRNETVSETASSNDLNAFELSELADQARRQESEQEKPGFVPGFDGKEHFDMGKVYKEMSLWDAAIAELKTAAMDPNWRAKSCVLLSECFRQKGEITLAISQLTWALSTGDELKETSDKYNLYFELGILLESAGNYSEAREQYQTVHRWNPSYRGVEKKLLELRKKIQAGV